MVQHRTESLKRRTRVLSYTIMMVLLVLLAASHLSSAATAARTIAGEILHIEGNIYIVKDRSGEEVRLHVDDKTDRLDHAVLQVGDPIRAYVTPEGHATSIKNLGPADDIELDDIRKPGMTPTK